MHFENRKGWWQIDVFCIIAKIEFEFMSNFVSLILGTSWTNMEAQEYFVLQFHCIWFVERENYKIRVVIPFLSSLFKVLFWFKILV